MTTDLDAMAEIPVSVQLQHELHSLREQLDKLSKEKRLLEISLEIVTEHADIFTAELFTHHHQLEEVVTEKQDLLRREQDSKKNLLAQLAGLCEQLKRMGQKEKNLEISLQTITEHADLIAEQLLEKQDLLERKVAERTHELAEKNALLEAEIRERLRAEAQLRESKEAAELARELAESANRAKSAFLATVSHELRTPLNAILGYSELLMSTLPAKGCTGFEEEVGTIHSSGERLLEIIQNMLDISKLESECMELHACEFNIAELVGHLVERVTPCLNGNKLAFSCPPDIGTMCADAMRVRQILQNLLSNAVKFTRQGQIRLLVSRTEEFIEFRVADTGIGIPANKLHLIFEAFNQVDNSLARNYEGMGIGLSLCKHLCHLMGGDIGVYSEIGKGSLFTVRLPAGTCESGLECDLYG